MISPDLSLQVSTADTTIHDPRVRRLADVQVIGSTHGTLVLVGTPQPAAMHDAKAWHASGLAALFDGRLHADGGPGGLADTSTGLCVPRRSRRSMKPIAAYCRRINDSGHEHAQSTIKSCDMAGARRASDTGADQRMVSDS